MSDQQSPKWDHNQRLSFKGLKELLLTVKERLESTIEEKKVELSQITNARDSLKNK